eukprot:108118-Amphidinium_carterae.1
MDVLAAASIWKVHGCSSWFADVRCQGPVERETRRSSENQCRFLCAAKSGQQPLRFRFMLNPCSCDAWQNQHLDPEAYALPDIVTPIQARGHVQFTTKEVLATTGQQREQWVGAG